MITVAVVTLQLKTEVFQLYRSTVTAVLLSPGMKRPLRMAVVAH
jgi:hypothetical protein